MSNHWLVIYIALGYVGALFAIAWLGDRYMRSRPRGGVAVYVLSLGVYCTSWTFFGSVGLAARSGFDFLSIYVGPALLLLFGWPLLRRIVSVAKRHNITSIADFISARYGKNQTLGALVALAAIIGVVPYISLQLKAVAMSLHTLMPVVMKGPGLFSAQAGDEMALLVTLAMAGFAMLFGTRHSDATEHQDGLILAIAVESVVKLLAFLAVGIFVVFVLMGGPGALLERMGSDERTAHLLGSVGGAGRLFTMTLLALFAFILLPRQFHVAVVENNDENHVRRAAWQFPLYLVAINLFVTPIAAAGIFILGSSVDADTYVLALPVSTGHEAIALIAFLGGLSAATAMVIMETVALSIMACNNLVMPYLLSRRAAGSAPYRDMGRVLLIIRRAAIAVMLALAYSYYRMAGASEALAQTGLLSFAAVAQFAPAFFGGLLWRRATAAGAMAGLAAGFAVWAYTLLIPSFADSGWIPAAFSQEGPFGIAALRPRALFGLSMDPLTHGVLWSLGMNLLAWVTVSLLTRPGASERMQAASFVAAEQPALSDSIRDWRSPVSIGQLQGTVARYLGEERTRRSFAEYAERHGLNLQPHGEADIHLLRFAEHLLASAVGAASSRLVMALLLKQVGPDHGTTLRLLDDVSAAIRYNRGLLQSAIDHVRQGIGVFDDRYRLICWNNQFRHLLRLPPEMGRVGVPMEDMMRAIMERAVIDGDMEKALAERLEHITESFTPYQERFGDDGTVLEVRSARMPDGGVVLTFADITERVMAADALQMANELLERRVEERTAELVRLNRELERAKAAAEKANLDKTRFIAAASHDILQPLNAARLFASSLVEKTRGSDSLARNIDASLESVEEILSALLDISRFDAGAHRPEYSTFPLNEILQPLAREFAPMAREAGLELRAVSCSAWVRSDRRLLRRALQNLLSNAIKYTPSGKVLLGCRRVGEEVRIEVHDSGPGIPEDKREAVFREFERLREHGDKTSGLGLGLSIVERICKVLDHRLELVSRPGHGTLFSISVPLAAEEGGKKEAEATVMEGETAGKSAKAAPVLVIDNEAAILEGMKELLGGWGRIVHVANSGAQALKAWREHPETGLIIADYHLDEEYGLEVIETIRAMAGWRVPAILITADQSREVREMAERHDVAYLRKPLKPAALRALMNRADALARKPAAE